MEPKNSSQVKAELLEKINSIEDTEILTLVVAAINKILPNDHPRSISHSYEIDLPQTVAKEGLVSEETQLEDGVSEDEYRFAMATIGESRKQIEGGEGIPSEQVKAMVHKLFLEN